MTYIDHLQKMRRSIYIYIYVQVLRKTYFQDTEVILQKVQIKELKKIKDSLVKNFECKSKQCGTGQKKV